MISEEKGLRHF